mmetsp:Transcript_3994/g.15958  ORF Transcript_3994/g.15958 Transcript_3994/m.15958 type:complete len:96 (-) Transcript_3994:2793-3080(-)
MLAAEGAPVVGDARYGDDNAGGAPPPTAVPGLCHAALRLPASVLDDDDDEHLAAAPTWVRSRFAEAYVPEAVAFLQAYIDHFDENDDDQEQRPPH